MVEISVEIKGLQEFKNKLNRFSNETKKEVDDAIQKTALFIEAKGKTFAPVDTGRLRNSIHYRKTAEYEAEVIVGAHYGAFVEFGTTRMRPQPYLRPAVNFAKPYGAALIKAAVEKAKTRA